MERRRNLLPLAGFLVCVVGFLSYFLLFSRYPVTRDVPWTGWLLFAVGLTLSGTGLARPFRQPERYRGKVTGSLLAALSLAVVGFFLFASAFAQSLPASAGAPKVGQKAPDFTLPDPQGKDVRLADLLGSEAGGAGSPSWVLLIFYRGYW